LNDLIKLLNDQGYVVNWDTLNPLDYYCPQSRERAYLWAFPVSLDPIDQFASSFLLPEWVANIKIFIRACRSEKTIPLHDFLVRNEHEWVISQIREEQAGCFLLPTNAHLGPLLLLRLPHPILDQTYNY